MLAELKSDIYLPCRKTRENETVYERLKTIEMKKSMENGFNLNRNLQKGSYRNSKQNQNEYCTGPTSRAGGKTDSELKN